MDKRRSSWIGKNGIHVYLAFGHEQKYLWKMQININQHGYISSAIDNPIIIFEDPVKIAYRKKDRAWFVRVCGKEYMQDKEVDHEWGSNPIWTRVITPMENGGRKRVQSYSDVSFVEKEGWLHELYPGKRR